MRPKHNPSLVPHARQLRKDMTKEERRLWYEYLRDHPARFTRQKILGRYIADFYSAQARLVIELDGSQHYDPQTQSQDAARTVFLQAYGLRVLRFPNNAVMQNFPGVCQQIDLAVAQSLPCVKGGGSAQPSRRD